MIPRLSDTHFMQLDEDVSFVSREMVVMSKELANKLLSLEALKFQVQM